jgi:hypothetical protein
MRRVAVREWLPVRSEAMMFEAPGKFPVQPDKFPVRSENFPFQRLTGIFGK